MGTSVILGRIQAVLRRWDPIGVTPGAGTGSAPADEYDGYAPRVLALLLDGAATDDLEAMLHKFRTTSMGLPARRSVDRLFAEELASLWQTRQE